MTDEEKLCIIMEDSKNPAWRWFPNNAEMLLFAGYLIDNGARIQDTADQEREPLEQEYYGYWGTCSNCGTSSRYGVNFCCNCGKKFVKEAKQ